MAMSLPIMRLRAALGRRVGPETPAEDTATKRVKKAPAAVVCSRCGSRCSATSHRCCACGRRLIAVSPVDSGRACGEPRGKPVEDERPAPVVGGFRELSLLTDVQLQILVSARYEDPRGEVRVCTAPADAVGAAAGTQRFDGPQAVEAVKLLLGSSYLQRTPAGTLSLTAHARHLAELARTSTGLAGRLRHAG